MASVIKVLMVMPHIEPDIFAGNYRRILELLANGYRIGIEYGTVEINSLVKFSRLLKRLFNYELEGTLLHIFELKGFGQGYDILSINHMMINILKFIPLSFRIRKTWYPDLILIPDALFSWVIMGSVANLIFKRPLIITIQLVPRWIIEVKDVNLKGLYRYFRRKYSAFKAFLQAIAARLYLFILSKAYLIVVSRAGVEPLSRINNNIFVNPNGIRVVQFNLPKIYDACFVGFHDERKGIFNLLEVWKRVTAVNPSAKLVTVGGIDDRMKKRWFNAIKSNKLDGNIIYLGKVTDREKFKILSASKVFIFPSKHELHPLTVGEALASGLPVVAYDIPALRENYGGCEGVLLCKLGDVECLAVKVLKLLRMNTAEQRKLAKKAMYFIENNYNWHNTLLREKAIYLTILKHRRCANNVS